MSRLLTAEELAALRDEAPYVPAPREHYHVVIDAGQASITPEALESLRVGDVVVVDRAARGPVEIVANGTAVALGELTAQHGRAAVRVTTLLRGGTPR